MKKLIAILAVFAVVAGAAFAKGAVDPDGTWGDVSISTRGAIGSVVDIDGVSTAVATTDDDNKVWLQHGDWTNYSLGLSYSWNILTVGMDFTKKGVEHYLKAGNDDISAKIKGSYVGAPTNPQILNPTYTGFEIEASHEEEWGSVEFRYNGNFANNDTTNPSKIWGSFSIYDTLFFKGGVGADQEVNEWLINDELIKGGHGNVTKPEKNNYFLFKYDLGGVVEGLEAGLYVPNLFVANTSENAFLNTVYGLKYDGGDIKLAFQVFGYVPGIRFQAELLSLVSFDVIIEGFDPLVMPLLGAKIKSPDIELGADAKLSASAKFYSENKFDTFHLDADIGLGFNAEPLGAQVDFEFRGEFGDTVNADGFKADLAIKPSVWYDIDPTHLRAKVGATIGISFNDNPITWSLDPELIYNFYGGEFGDFSKKNDDSKISTGMYLGYSVGGRLGDNSAITNNKVTLGMKWSF